MAAKIKNVTSSLPTELTDEFKEYTTKIDKEKLKKEMAEAANDQLFIADLKESMDSF